MKDFSNIVWRQKTTNQMPWKHHGVVYVLQIATGLTVFPSLYPFFLPAKTPASRDFAAGPVQPAPLPVEFIIYFSISPALKTKLPPSWVVVYCFASMNISYQTPGR